jgi:hypothetical protein
MGGIRICAISKSMCAISRICIGKRSLHNSAGCKDSRVGLSITLLPLSLDSRLLSFHRLGDNIGISIAVWVDSMVSIGVWKVVGVSISHSWGLDLNSLDDRLNNWCGIGIVKSIGVGMVKSIGEIVWISLWVSLGLSITLLPLSLDSRLLSFYRLGDNIGISIAVWVVSMVSIGVWEVVVSIGDSSWGLDLNSLDDRLNNWCGVHIGMVKSIGVGMVKSIAEIVGIGLWVSLGFSLTLLPLSLDSRFSFSNGSSSGENNWESVSPETIVVSIWDMSIGDKWSRLNLSRCYFNRLDDWQMGDSMVSSIHKRSVEKKLRISLCLSSDSSNEGNHQQELHVVIAM